MHCQTHALKAWIDRPTYGAPPLDTFPTPVPGKCSLLEDIHGDAATRRCSRTPTCNKPDRHAGYCDGSSDGPRLPTNLVVRLLRALMHICSGSVRTAAHKMHLCKRASMNMKPGMHGKQCNMRGLPVLTLCVEFRQRSS